MTVSNRTNQSQTYVLPAHRCTPIFLRLFLRSKIQLLLPIIIALPLAAIAFFTDGFVVDVATNVRPGIPGDIRRVLEVLQQFGDASYVILAGLIVLTIDPARRRYLLDLIAGALITLAIAHIFKILLGRPRPGVGDHDFFAGPFAYPIQVQGKYVMLHSWEVFTRGASQLWSMPSSHTSAAATMSVFLCRHYPRMRFFAIAMVVVVGSLRVLFGAHHLADVIMGAGLGFSVSWFAISDGLISRRFTVRRFGAIVDVI